MDEVFDFFRKLLSTADFPPRWHCGRWSDFHGWLYLLSDLAIWGAYFTLPVIIVSYIAKKQDVRFSKIYFLFAAFIVACGSTHFLDALAFWYPFYRLSALVRFATAIISWVTVFSLIKMLPAAFSLKTAEQFEAEIEQRRKAEDQLRINNQLLNEAQDIAKLGHWQWDVPANKVTWSQGAIKVFGRAAGSPQITYDDYLLAIHPEDRQYVSDAISDAISKQVFPTFYHRILLPNGQTRLVLSKGEVIVGNNGQTEQMIGTVQDVTDQKNFEQELLIKSQRLEASNEELQKFASIASHDLREPLRKILTFGSMLEKEYTDVLGDKGITFLHKMTMASLRMQKLIDDILDFSKLTVNVATFEKVNLNELVTQVLSDMEVAIDSSGAEITVGTLPEIDANASQLGQLFQNLLGNAIKFRREGERPHIPVKGDIITVAQLPADFFKSIQFETSVFDGAEYRMNERFCQLTIEDDGIGFDATFLDKIFLIFQRLHSRAEYEGTGIGLAVVKKVVDLHNGYITASSKPGAGATFIIILPINQQAN